MKPHRTLSAVARQRILRNATRDAAPPRPFEPLERRMMLTTITGGGYDADGQPLSSFFDFKDTDDKIIRIIVGGDTEAEFVGATFNEETGAMTLGDLTPAPVDDDDDDVPGSDLFAIYVTESDADSFISIGELEDEDNNPDVLPYQGNVTLTVRDLQDNGDWTSMATDGGTGVALLGARSPAVEDVDDSENRPILSADLTEAIGVLPLGPGDTLRAGLTIAGGNDFGRFLFGGTITGRVRITGSIDQFYAGMLLTGDARGDGFAPSVGNNFRVDGDLRNLLVLGSAGTMEAGEGNPLDEPRYLSGFDLYVGGRLGQVNVKNNLYGLGDVLMSSNERFRRAQSEVEARGTQLVDDTTVAGEYRWERGYVDSDGFFNDSYDTAQYLGTIDSQSLNKDNYVQVQGTLQAIDDDDFDDFVDYYAVPLMAGQTVQAQLRATGLTRGLMNLGIYDPDGRLVSTDYSDVDFTATQGRPIRFTADRPGVYRFAVATVGDGDFNGPNGMEASEIGVTPYELRVSGVQNLGIGGIVAGGNLFNHTSRTGFTLGRGDFGALEAGGNLMSSAARTVVVKNGNLRAIQGGDIGLLKGINLTLGAEVVAPKGGVGLVRSTDGILVLNGVNSRAVGTDYQVIDAEDTFYGNVIANRRVGVIRAGDMATRAPSVITVNADERGRDGVIDLIDVAGDLGTLQGGGPWITTGPGGNVRYMNVEGTLYRDEQFGGGNPQQTQFNPGESVTLNDDSGAQVTITPGDAAFGPASLEILTYGIRGSGGVAVVRVGANGSMNIRSAGKSKGAGVEIGKVLTTGVGSDLFFGPDGPVINTDPTQGDAQELAVNISGEVPVDVLSIQGRKFTEILNNTTGEIVSAIAESIGRLEGETVGMARHTTAAAVLPNSVLVADMYPFRQLRNAIVTADLGHLEADDSIGNVVVSPALTEDAFNNFVSTLAGQIDVSANTGSIGFVYADADRKRSKKFYEGIAGALYASGNIGELNLGQGVAPSGSGDPAQAGVFAEGRIGNVRGVTGTDIRGNIASETAIDSIRLTGGGSIINAAVYVGELEHSREFHSPRTLTSDNDSITDPTFEIGEVLLTSDKKGAGRRGQGKGGPGGGIIGSLFQASDIGRIDVANGFGILNSVFSVPGNGVIDGISTDGYGVRDTIINSGAMLGDLIARGRGKHAAVNTFNPAVRQSEDGKVDPFSGQLNNRLTDLHSFLGTSGNNGTRKNVTNTGMIAGVSAAASRDLEQVEAWEIRRSTTSNQLFPTTFNFANSIGTMDVRRDVNGLSIVTGGIDELNIGRNAIRLDAQVAGTIGVINVGRDYADNSSIFASGSDGNISEINVGEDLAGRIRASRNIGRLRVGGELTGEVTEGGKPVQPE